MSNNTHDADYTHYTWCYPTMPEHENTEVFFNDKWEYKTDIVVLYQIINIINMDDQAFKMPNSTHDTRW